MSSLGTQIEMIELEMEIMRPPVVVGVWSAQTPNVIALECGLNSHCPL